MYHYTGRLAGNWLDAALRWASEGKPDSAIKEFLKLQASIDSPGLYAEGIKLLVAAMAIHKRFRDVNCPPCDSRLFESFNAATIEMSLEERKESQKARSDTFHPSTPNATNLLALVEREDPLCSEASFDNMRIVAARKIACDFLRAAYILRLQGQENEAVQLEEIVQRRDPPFWKRREEVHQALEKDARLKRLRDDLRSKQGWLSGKTQRTPGLFADARVLYPVDTAEVLTQVDRQNREPSGVQKAESRCSASYYSVSSRIGDVGI